MQENEPKSGLNNLLKEESPIREKDKAVQRRSGPEATGIKIAPTTLLK